MGGNRTPRNQNAPLSSAAATRDALLKLGLGGGAPPARPEPPPPAPELVGRYDIATSEEGDEVWGLLLLRVEVARVDWPRERAAQSNVF